MDLPVLKHNLLRALRSQTCSCPDNYLVFDLETTGLEFRSGVIWQIGMFPVMGGKPISEEGMSITLDTPRADLEKNAFEVTRRVKAAVGLEEFNRMSAHDPAELEYLHHATAADYLSDVASNGVPRAEGFAAAVEMLSSYIDSGWPIVGQNLVHFDVPFFENDSLRNGTAFKFPVEGVIDVGVLIKAAKLSMRYLDRETLRAFFNRVSSIRAKGVYFAIERFCVPYWDMVTRFGVDLAKAHDAGYDCWITHLIFRELIQDAEAGKARGVWGKGEGHV